jgi:hypothetical protein
MFSLADPADRAAAALGQLARARRLEAEALDALGEIVVVALSRERAAAEYTSMCPPPGMSRKRFAARCLEALRAGDARVCKRGRVWIASPTVFDAVARTAGAAAPPSTGAGSQPANDGPSRAFDAAMSDLGARPTRSRGAP